MVMAKKQYNLQDLRRSRRPLTEKEAKAFRGGLKNIPGASPSNGAFPWLEIDIRRPYEEQHPGLTPGVRGGLR